MSETAIRVQNLGKRYRIGASAVKEGGTLRALGRGLASPFTYLRRSLTQAGSSETVWALKDVSFEVPPSQVVGIIGRNGAGKTTLLKVLSRITDPTEGLAEISGRVGCLLAVGTGFHPELTGRENVFLNGAIMGMKKKEIRQRFDEILDFAEVTKFIDTPVKYYSSGMYVRLAFAVAAHLEPEVLIVDEVLAVGDLTFQKKCLGKMDSVARQGRTVLLVSHNMESILGLCQRTLWMDGGRLVADGPTEDVVRAYTQSCLQLASEGSSIAALDREGDGRLRFSGFSLRDGQGQPLEYATCGEPVEFVLSYHTNGEELRHVSAWFWIKNHLKKGILCFYTHVTGQDFERLPPSGQLVCRVPRLPLPPGNYLVDLSARAAGVQVDRVPEAARLDVAPGDFFGTGRATTGLGDVLCEQSWDLEA